MLRGQGGGGNPPQGSRCNQEAAMCEGGMKIGEEVEKKRGRVREVGEEREREREEELFKGRCCALVL